MDFTEPQVAKVTTIIELKDGRKLTAVADEPWLEWGIRTDTYRMELGYWAELYPLPGRTLEVHYKIRPFSAKHEIDITMEVPADGPH